MEEFFYALKKWEVYFGEMVRVVLYSDGSGHVEDDNKESVFAFQDLIEFVNSNPAEIYNAQKSVYLTDGGLAQADGSTQSPAISR
jgi:hypothetical protein